MTTPSAHALNEYEGLVRSTTARYVSVMAGAAMDFDDIAQFFRVRVWKALEEYDPTIWADRDGFVFMCIRNAAKDLVRRRQERLQRDDPAAQDAWYIEDIAPQHAVNGQAHERSTNHRDRFEDRYLSADEEDVFADVLDDPPDIPDTLTRNERRVLLLMYNDYSQVEIAPLLKLTTTEVKTAVKNIRVKLDHLRPSASENGKARAA